MSSLVKLTRPQKRRLTRLVQRSRESRPVRRAQVMLQLASGVCVTEISDALSVARSTIYLWAARFDALGEAYLMSCDSGRRAYTVDETLRETLLELVSQPPSDYDYLRSTWTSEMLAQTLAALLERPIHASTVRRELWKLGLRWRRARPTLRIRHPSTGERMKAIKERLSKPESGTEVFFVDEADIDLNPRIGFLWSPMGQQAAIPTPGKNQKRYLAGALHARTGRVHYVEGLRKNTDLFLCLLESLKRTYRCARKIVLIADNYIVHKSNLAQAWLKHNRKFEILFQPAYQPWVNDIEKLWKQLHDNITRNHRYATIDRLMVAVRAFMRAASPFPGNSPSVASFGSRI
jgi:putative transposase